MVTQSLNHLITWPQISCTLIYCEFTYSRIPSAIAFAVFSAKSSLVYKTEYIGVLVEAAYMTNPIDSVLYTREDFAENTAKAIAEGILEYVNSQ